ncbi:MAG: discoidin domain-containing protein [Victivallales bacterium]|nr:discoidin domain-containing protein [Victivallales bacterium]
MFKRFLIGTLVAATAVTWAADDIIVNLALKAKATVSSQENDSLVAANATDGNYYSRWSSQRSDPQWIMLDLDKPKTFACVVLFWETAYSAEYKLEISDDGKSWKTVYEQKKGQGKIEDIYLKKSVTARYFRVYSEKRGTGYGVSLREIQLFAR